jgi:hypothetical protein
MRLAPTVLPVALALAGIPATARSQEAQGEAGPGLEGEYVQLVVGQRARLCPGGNCRSPICDDPGTAVISADGSGVLEARAPGFTTCSVDYGLGQRRILQVEVVARQGTPPARTGGTSGPAPAFPSPPAPSTTPGVAPRAPAPRTAASPSPPDAGAIYRWTAPDGSVQFGYEQDLSAAQRDRAVRVTGDISVVPTPVFPARPASAPPAPPPVDRRDRAATDLPVEIDLPPPTDVLAPDTIEPGDLQCWTAANGRMTCSPYGQRQRTRPGPAPQAPGSAGTPSR